MNFNVPEYVKILSKHNIAVIYSGPVWSGGIDGMSEMLQRRLDIDNLTLDISHSVFSVFVEQMNNMLMYSADKEILTAKDGAKAEVSKGIFVLGVKEKTYFVYTGNVLTNHSAEILKERIEHLNTLDKKELRKYYKERLKSENDNPESKGAGLGLIEIARRATSKIAYNLTEHDDGRQYFTIYVEI